MFTPMMAPGGGGVALPSGIILPMRAAASVPSGWTIFSTGDNKHIIGAGSTYSVGDSITDDGNFNLGYGGAGTHSGDSKDFGSAANQAGPNAQGDHTDHDFEFTSPAPYNESMRLIKADSEVSDVPADALLLKHSASGWADLTRHYDGATNRLLRSASSASQGGKVSMAVTASSGGAHNHGTNSGADGGTFFTGMRIISVLRGAHTHTWTSTLTFNLYRVALSAWYKASAFTFEQSNAIGMYESLTPPAGWSLCNGTGGTPDLRDKFIEINTSDANAGTAYGTGKVNSDLGASSSDGGHNHVQSLVNSTDENARHNSTVGAHTHALADVDLTWLPAGYALAFIMYTG